MLVSDISDSGGNETVRQITLSGGKAAFRHCNVSRPEEVGALVAFAEETFGGLDILINNASGPGYKPVLPQKNGCRRSRSICWERSMGYDTLCLPCGSEAAGPSST